MPQKQGFQGKAPKPRYGKMPRQLIIVSTQTNKSVHALTMAQYLGGQPFPAHVEDGLLRGEFYAVMISFPGGAYPSGRLPLEEQQSFFSIMTREEMAAFVDHNRMLRMLRRFTDGEYSTALVGDQAEAGRLVLLPQSEAPEAGDPPVEDAPNAAVPAPLVTVMAEAPRENGNGPDTGTPFKTGGKAKKSN